MDNSLFVNREMPKRVWRTIQRSDKSRQARNEGDRELVDEQRNAKEPREGIRESMACELEVR